MAQSQITSMTGFARSTGQWQETAWVWELKSVNGKSLDVRFRLPPGFDGVEFAAKAIASATLKRGNVQASFNLSSAQSATALKVNHGVLESLVTIAENLRDRLGSAPIQAENLLALRGVLDQGESQLTEAEQEQRNAAILTSFEQAINNLAQARSDEGSRLAEVLAEQLTRIKQLTDAARNDPSRKPEAVRQRLAEQVARLLEQADGLDAQRLHQEAILLATKADIQEELDRLDAHVLAAEKLMRAHEPVGRKFDFLAQEFNREANTLCSKSAATSLTTIGLDLKTVIDQMREQIQNIE